MDPSTQPIIIRERGFSFVELMVAITLLGVVAVSVMTSMSTTVQASSRQRELAASQAWLQSATAVLEIMGKQLCSPDNESARLVYQGQLRAEAINSEGWPTTALTVESIMFWDDTTWTSECSGELQRVTLRVQSPSGLVSQTLEVVVDDPYTQLDRASDPGVDPPSSCTVVALTVKDKKALGPTILLKKPSTTKPSKVKNHDVTFTVVTSGLCRGELRVTYQYWHKTHWHTRKPKLKPVKDVPNTYIAKVGHGDKYLVTAQMTLTVQEHRRKSKRWTTVTNGVYVNAFRFQ